MSLSKPITTRSNNLPHYMTLYQSQEVIKTKKDFHEALDRNGYYVLPYKSGGCTIDYLKKVRSKQVWCPMYVDVVLRSCYVPPKKEVVFEEVLKELKRLSLKPFGFTDAGKVPSEWLIRCLSTLNSDHKFFEKSYYPEESKLNSKFRRRMEDQVIIKSDDNFFNDLR